MQPQRVLVLMILALCAVNCRAQQAVPAGKGAYAASIPPGIADGAAEKADSQKLYLLKEDGRPIPSNKWYQSLLLNQYGKGLWPYPFKVDTGAKGLEVFYPTQWTNDGNEMVTNYPVTVGGKDFQPADSRVKSWSDWLVSFRMAQASDRYMDVTLGQGMPYVWIEYRGVQPQIGISGNARYFDLAANSVSLPYTGDAIGIEFAGRACALFAPDGATFTADGTGLSVAFKGAAQYLVLCALPAAKDIAVAHRYAYAVPRNTQLSWQYDAAKGVVTTNWKVTTEALKGSEHRIIQGWLPHHYRACANKLDLEPLEYATPRGKMRCAIGNEFTLSYSYTGILPNLPAPRNSAAYDAKRMSAYLNMMADNPRFAADTYGGGKDLVRFAQAALMAKQTSDPSYTKLVGALRAELTDWLTYTPSKRHHLFAYYPRRKGLVGFDSSFGSEHFTDNHFHYGYMTFAAGVLAMLDPGFANDYGPMLRLIVKQYANGDHADARFPLLRTFDCWAGHSWADGNGFTTGNNQESTSEAVQSWSGVILLGQALGDKEMLATGVMGYTFETQSTMEYWFNAHGDVFPPAWKHPSAGMIWSNGIVWGTWFTASPSWIFGIQWIPCSPAASYLARDPAFARSLFDSMMRETEADEVKQAARRNEQPHAVSIKTFGGELGSYMLGFRLLYDPKWVIEQMDTLWNQPDDRVAHNPYMAIAYYMAHSAQSLGRVDWGRHTSSATAMVYINDAKKRSYVAWNPTAEAQTISVYEGARALGSFTALPYSLTLTTTLK